MVIGNIDKDANDDVDDGGHQCLNWHGPKQQW